MSRGALNPNAGLAQAVPARIPVAPAPANLVVASAPRGRRSIPARTLSSPRRLWPVLVGLLLATWIAGLAGPALAAEPYQRPVDAAPKEEDIGAGYVTPVVPTPAPRAAWREVVDVGALVVGLGLASWLALKQRSRSGLFLLAIAGVAYFGFYRQGCICPIGAIQNVTVALLDPRYSISAFVLAYFFLPLIAALFFGRVFCSGVCPLGALQELIVLRPLHLPRWLDRTLGWLKWVYLVLAVWYAARPALTRDFLICRFDPFVGFFRFTGPLSMLLIGAGFVVLGLFVGRPYCRFLCPYGALLSLASRLAWRSVTVTPNKELDCGLCAEACPYGAIDKLRAVRSSCVACGRCYAHCPRHRAQAGKPPP